LKKLVVLLFFIIGLFFLILTNTSWLSFSQKDKQVEVTDQIDSIEIDVSGVSTTIIPEDRNSVSTVYNGKGKVSIAENGDTIKIEYTSKNWFHVFSWFKKIT
jgi:lia operon protein LiaG